MFGQSFINSAIDFNPNLQNEDLQGFFATSEKTDFSRPCRISLPSVDLS